MSFNPEQPYQDLPPLPPRTEVETPRVLKAVVDASRHLASLNMACMRLPDPSLLINIAPLLEAQASSEIENIVTTNDELFRAAHDALDESGSPAVKEALRYRAALKTGFEHIQRRPLSFQTARAVASELSGTDIQVRSLPGTFIGNPRSKRRVYTPPDGKAVLLDKLSEWERFIHNHEPLDPIVAMALQHYQFEAIHPFHDGNGRTGRILNLLCLNQFGLLNLPVLYLSGYFVRHKDQYYQLLRAVTEESAWEDWVIYVANGVSESAQSALNLAEQVVESRTLLEAAIRADHPRMPAADIAALLHRQPYVRIDDVVRLDLAKRATASSWLNELADAGLVLQQKIGRGRVFINTGLLSRIFSISDSDTAPA
ncbi:Fic family protein [Ancrocorticia sp.]